MPPINVQVDQGYNQAQQNISTGARQGQISTQPQVQSPAQIAARLAGVRTGTVVEGSVLSQNSDGTYLVRVDVNGVPQELRARATLSLIPGEHFRAVWDASGPDGVPVLRLSQGELSFLSQIPARDRELATALLSRGLPLSSEVLNAIKDAWRKNGGDSGELSSFIELWARDVPMTQENAALLSQYAAMNGQEATEMWNRIRKELRERSKGGRDPVKALRDMKDGSDEVAKFLQAQSILMKSPRNDVNPALLAAPFWPLMENSSQNMTARIYVGRSAQEDGQRYWQVGFGITGSVLGEVGGLVESDGKSCNLTLNAEKPETCKILERRRRELRRELQGLEIPVTFIGIAMKAPETERDMLLAGRGLDITV
ncbi:MAG: hypothetical protein IJS39_12060 [Synergistaceae bacterium]|nr:hypothetical protein [Synergistaceae bacterium]